MRFHVVKSTTDKLQDTLNDFNWDSPEWAPELVRVEYMGGRDWVIVIRALSG